MAIEMGVHVGVKRWVELAFEWREVLDTGVVVRRGSGNRRGSVGGLCGSRVAVSQSRE